MLEPIQGEAGVWPATDQFLQELRALTQAHGLLLIFDEIQTGMGRTGKLFHYEHAGIVPDIMTLGKGIGGGAPLAALLATEEASCFEHGDQGGTFNGNSLMCAAGFAVLDEVSKSDFLSNLEVLVLSNRECAGEHGVERKCSGPLDRVCSGIAKRARGLRRIGRGIEPCSQRRIAQLRGSHQIGPVEPNTR